MADLHALRASGEATAAQWQIVSESKPAEELYATPADPHEVTNLIETEGSAELAAPLGAALDAWIESTGDLGLMPEGEMVRTRLWPPVGEQPKTAAPALGQDTQGNTHLFCDTPGASIGYRERGEKVWRIFTRKTPFTEGKKYEAVAHRIGYVQSPVFSFQTHTPR